MEMEHRELVKFLTGMVLPEQQSLALVAMALRKAAKLKLH